MRSGVLDDGEVRGENDAGESVAALGDAEVDGVWEPVVVTVVVGVGGSGVLGVLEADGEAVDDADVDGDPVGMTVLELDGVLVEVAVLELDAVGVAVAVLELDGVLV